MRQSPRIGGLQEWAGIECVMPNLLTHPPRLPLVSASILSADFAAMGEECRSVLAAGADMLHLDVMDGHFAPNLTMGPDMCKAVRASVPDAFLDVHLMVTNPSRFIESFTMAGVDHLTFHVEALGGYKAVKLARIIRTAGATAGIALNPATDVSTILPIIKHFDMVLVMSVVPGYSGQAFIESVLANVRLISAKLRPDQRLEMDGGIGVETASACVEAGCDVLAAASAIFGQPPETRAGIIDQLRKAGRSENVQNQELRAENN